MPEAHPLVHLNAALNATAFVLLACGWLAVMRRRIRLHRTLMLSAFSVSIAFLASYLTYHYQAGSVKFPGHGAARALYLSILLTHTALAAILPFLASRTLWLAWKQNFVAHRRLARWTLPIWIYVSLTGVVVYWMLYRMRWT